VLLQVLYIPQQPGLEHASTCTTKLLQQCLSTVQLSADADRVYDKYGDGTALTEQRQCKWQRNMAALLEFFSATGVLAEVAAWEVPEATTAPAAVSKNAAKSAAPPPAVADSKKANPSTTTTTHSSSTAQTGAGTEPVLQPPEGTLAALGYAALSRPDQGPDSSWLHRTGWCQGSAGNLHQCHQ
jgi:hypothetical protein